VEKPVRPHEVIRIRSNSLRHCERPPHSKLESVPPPTTQFRDVLK